MHPSTGSGRTEAHFGDRLSRLFALRQAQGERKCNLGIVFPGCSPFDRLRANGSAFWGSSSPAVHPSTGSGRTEAHFGDRLPRQCTLRQAQGERKCNLGIVFPGCSPFDRLRANGLRCQRQRAYTLRRVAREPSQALRRCPLHRPESLLRPSRRSPLWHIA